MGDAPQEERLAALEAKVAYLEKESEDLNQALVAQQRQLDDLEFKLKAAAARLRQVHHALGDQIPDEPPPHY